VFEKHGKGGRLGCYYAPDHLNFERPLSPPALQKHTHDATKDSSTYSKKRKTCLYFKKKIIKNQFGAN